VCRIKQATMTLSCRDMANCHETKSRIVGGYSGLPDAACGEKSGELHSGMAGDREAELEGWIEKTQRLQRRLAWIYGALGVAALGLTRGSGQIGGFALFAVVLVAICSFWVTAAHNAAHRQKLAELRRVADNGGKPLETAHRRWHARDDR